MITWMTTNNSNTRSLEFLIAIYDQLAKQKLPAIAHWEGKHYVVVYEVTPKQVIIADPAIGQRHLTYPEFKAGWTGYTLLLQPTALIKKLKDTTTPFWQWWELGSPQGQGRGEAGGEVVGEGEPLLQGHPSRQVQPLVAPEVGTG